MSEHAGQVNEPRKLRSRGSRRVRLLRKAMVTVDRRKATGLPPGSESLARTQSSSTREPGDLGEATPLMVGGRQGWEGEEPQATPGCSEKSDEPIVPEKQPNTRVTPVEAVEGRGEANGKSARGNAAGTLSPETRGHATVRIGERARRCKGERFTNLFSHLRVALLREAYYQIKRRAAPGIDGETWSSYGDGLEERLRDLESRLHCGRYRPQPVRRVRIPKGDGRTRPLGIPTLEDKIVQQAARTLLEPIYENSEFLGFSYGFRPGRSPHRAIEALKEALKRKVDWVLDADIRSFLDPSSYCTLFHERSSKRLGCVAFTLILKPFRLPRHMCTASSSPRFTRCNTVWRETPSTLVASIIGM